MRGSKWTWAPDPRKVKMPVHLKLKVELEMDELIEDVLRKKHLKPLPKDKETNYVVDLYTKRQRQYFYFCAKYRARSKNRMADYFEIRFARLEYTAGGYNLAYMRHTGKWWEIYRGLTLKNALQTVASEVHFEP